MACRQRLFAASIRWIWTSGASCRRWGALQIFDGMRRRPWRAAPGRRPPSRRRLRRRPRAPPHPTPHWPNATPPTEPDAAAALPPHPPPSSNSRYKPQTGAPNPHRSEAKAAPRNHPAQPKSAHPPKPSNSLPSSEIPHGPYTSRAKPKRPNQNQLEPSHKPAAPKPSRHDVHTPSPKPWAARCVRPQTTAGSSHRPCPPRPIAAPTPRVKNKSGPQNPHS